MGEFLRSPVHASSLRDRASRVPGIGHTCRMENGLLVDPPRMATLALSEVFSGYTYRPS
jgi:hypothetical protein